MSCLRTWERLFSSISKSIFCAYIKYEFENKFSLSILYLTTKCVPVCLKGKIFDVGDEYRSTGRNISTNSQILAGIPLGSYQRNSYNK